jgi:hypothetical protein
MRKGFDIDIEVQNYGSGGYSSPTTSLFVVYCTRLLRDAQILFNKKYFDIMFYPGIEILNSPNKEKPTDTLEINSKQPLSMEYLTTLFNGSVENLLTSKI